MKERERRREDRDTQRETQRETERLHTHNTNNRKECLLRRVFTLKTEPSSFPSKNNPVAFCILQAICILATFRVPRHVRQNEG